MTSTKVDGSTVGFTVPWTQILTSGQHVGAQVRVALARNEIMRLTRDETLEFGTELGLGSTYKLRRAPIPEGKI